MSLLISILILAQVFWAKTIGGVYSDQGVSTIQTQDGGYILAGVSNSFSESYDILLLKLSSEGSIIWAKTLGGEKVDRPISLINTVDGGFILLGYTESFGMGHKDIIIVKFFEDGSVSWSKTVGAEGEDFATSIVQAQDGGFILVGYTKSFGKGEGDILIIKLDNDGSLKWAKIAGTKGYDFLSSVVKTDNNSFIAVGGINNIHSGNTNFFVLRLTYDGTPGYNMIFPWTNGYAVSCVQTSDEGFVIVGNDYSISTNEFDIVVIKLSSDFSFKWAKVFGKAKYDDIVYSLSLDQKDEFIITGSIETEYWGENILLFKVDSSGSLKWAKKIGGEDSDVPERAVKTSDGGFLITGSTKSFGYNEYDMFILKFYEELNRKSIGYVQDYCEDYLYDIYFRNLSPLTRTSSISLDFSDCPMQTTNPKLKITPIPKMVVVDLSMNNLIHSYLFTDIIDSSEYFVKKTFGKEKDEQIYSLTEDKEGGYLLCGYTNSIGSGDLDCLLLNIASNGYLKWSKIFGGVYNDNLYAVSKTMDNNFILVGNTTSFDLESSEFLIMNVSSNGSLNWAKAIGSESYDEAKTVLQTKEGDFIVGGITKKYYDNNDQNLLILKLTKKGSLVWGKELIDEKKDDIPRLLFETQDGGFLVAGETQNADGSQSDILIMKYKNDGSHLWAKRYGGSKNDDLTSILQSKDSTIIVLGSTNSFGGSKDILVFKLNTDGSLVWAKTYGSEKYDYPLSIVETEDGRLVIVGFTGKSGRDELIVMILKQDGSLLEAKIFWGLDENLNEPVSLINKDGGYILIDKTDKKGAGGNDILSLIFDPRWNAPELIKDFKPNVKSIKLKSSNLKIKITETQLKTKNIYP